ncbi:MAG: hypothetical protein JSV24_02710 [Bacteroidales bacterium]|nr:MAG: hypothetical protein JSV24_02710 [Bacteroidales bacterium]
MRENIEFIEDQDARKESRKGSIRDFIDGSILTREIVIKQLPFIIFVVFLAIIYIGNRYHAEKIVRETVVLQNQVKELRSEAITTSAELMSKSRQSVVSRLVKENNLELEELLEPPGKIIIKEK